MRRYLVCGLLLLSCAQCEDHSVSKRALLFPASTILQFSYGLSVPYILPSRSINLSLVLQANYNLPYNLTNFMPMVISARQYVTSTFDIDRKTFYKYLVEFLDGVGLDGESCLLRSVCEVAEVPMHVAEKNGLLESIVHYALTPSLDLDRESAYLVDNATLSFTDRLLVAEDMGRSREKCGRVYSECILSVVDLFTKKYIVA